MGFRDMDLDDQVKANLRRDRDLSGYRIQVSVRNGIVYLRGNVSQRAKKHAVKLARGTDSVAAVIDEMIIV